MFVPALLSPPTYLGQTTTQENTPPSKRLLSIVVALSRTALLEAFRNTSIPSPLQVTTSCRLHPMKQRPDPVLTPSSSDAFHASNGVAIGQCDYLRARNVSLISCASSCTNSNPVVIVYGPRAQLTGRRSPCPTGPASVLRAVARSPVCSASTLVFHAYTGAPMFPAKSTPVIRSSLTNLPPPVASRLDFFFCVLYSPSWW